MIYPTPRTDRWEPWILAALCVVALSALLAIHFSSWFQNP